MIEISITKTSKVNPRDKYTIYAQDLQTFSNMKEARSWIKENYGDHKRSSMFIDTEDGTALKCGYVIGFRTREYTEGHWINVLESHWLTFYNKERLSL